MKKHLSHSNINKALSVICILFGLYLLLTPIVRLPINKSNDFPSGKKIEAVKSNDQILSNQPNYVEFLNSSHIKSEIIEGPNIDVIGKGGLWRVASSSNNPNVSNMVVVGHNFDYNNTYPPFRTLPESKVGDNIRMVWQDKIYLYQIKKVEIHNPSDTYIEKPTEKPTLTMYTCYPMFMAKERFVVTAELI